MNIFISWSGTTSHQIALILRDWLPSVINSVETWVSSEDIQKGERWGMELFRQLDETSYGIICITPDNSQSPWLNFEAGALSKSLERGKVFPFLFGVPPSELKGPLSLFQVTQFDRKDVLMLVKSINSCLKESRISTERLLRLFEISWPGLEIAVSKINISPMGDDEASKGVLTSKNLSSSMPTSLTREQQYQIAFRWVERGRKDSLAQYDLSGTDLRAAELMKADLRGVDLSRANLITANLKRANLRMANLKCANLTGANLISADLRGAVFDRETNLKEANLSRANLTGAILDMVNFQQAILTNDYQGGGVILQGASMRGAILQRLDLQGLNFQRADLQGADFTESNLMSANLREANLSNAMLSSADLRGADLYRAILNGANLNETILSGEYIGDSWTSSTGETSEANLEQCSLVGTDLRKTKVTDSQLSSVGNLSGVTMPRKRRKT